MADHLLLPILLAVAVGEQWWTRRRIRQHFAAQDMAVTSIRWQPWAPLMSFEFKRLTSLYRVRYVDAQGRRWSCRFVSGLWDGFHADETMPEPDGTGPVTGSTTDAPAPTASAASLLGFYAAAVGCAAVSCLWMGLSYWTPPLKSLNLPDALYGLGLLSVAGFAFALARWQPRQAIGGGAIMAAAVLAVISIRIANDLARDPSTHNLLGIEVLMGLGIGGAAAALGVLLARIRPAG